MGILDHIEALAEKLTPENYEIYKRQFDRLADKIIVEEKDKYFKEHPDQCQ